MTDTFESNGVPRDGGAIVAEGIERVFGENRAVDGVDLVVREGEIYGFLGPNGAGKSTLVRMLCTLLAPTGGQATVAGRDVIREPEAVRLRIGVALQNAALDEKQTGVEMLRLQGRFYGLFILFFPFAFLTTTFLPQEALTGWLSTIADYNPVTYLLEALRSLITEGWSAGPLLRGIGAIAAVASFTLAMLALKGRVSRG